MKKENNTHSIESQNVEEILHALADGQLESAEREEILALLDNDSELRGEMCDIYRIKDLVQTAYPLSDFKQQPPSRFDFKSIPLAKVASYFLAFVLTFVAGYLIRDVANPVGDAGIALANVPVQDNKVILFLSSSDPKKFIKILAKAEALAKKFDNTDGKVYVVTSAAGVDLLRLKTSPYQHEIKELTNLYPALNFVACNNSLYQFKKAGKSIELIDSAKVAPSAVEFVVDHLQKGWRYIAI
ncbi:MAG: hypothetical protein V3U84_07740 [Thiotrichaceae bacterium]